MANIRPLGSKAVSVTLSMDTYRKLRYLAELQNTSVSRIAGYCLQRDMTLLEDLQWRFLFAQEVKEGRTFPRMDKSCPFYREAPPSTL